MEKGTTKKPPNRRPRSRESQIIGPPHEPSRLFQLQKEEHEKPYPNHAKGGNPADRRQPMPKGTRSGIEEAAAQPQLGAAGHPSSHRAASTTNEAEQAHHMVPHENLTHPSSHSSDEVSQRRHNADGRSSLLRQQPANYRDGRPYARKKRSPLKIYLSKFKLFLDF